MNFTGVSSIQLLSGLVGEIAVNGLNYGCRVPELNELSFCGTSVSILMYSFPKPESQLEGFIILN